MNKRLFPRMAFCLTLITSFLFMPFSAVYADGLTQDSEYWKWWYIENTTDAITDGQGASADNITDTYNGSTVGQYVYDQTGLTADDVKEYVHQQYENATGYVEHTAEWYSSAVDDIWNSSIDAATKAKYQAEKALRETVNTAGNTVVNVSSSGYWNNVYNDIFNSGGYKDQYTVNNNGGFNVTVNNENFTIEYAGVTLLSNLISADTATASAISSVVSETNIYSIDTPVLSSYDYQQNIVVLIKITVGEYSGYVRSYNFRSRFSEYNFVNQSVSMTEYAYTFTYGSDQFTTTQTIYFNGIASQTGNSSDPVLQPKQVGYVIHNGIEYPVYTDPSLNPFKINDNGIVSFNDGSGDEPIYIDPTQLTDDGSLDILSWLDQDNLTQNPYNPFGKPWNTQDDGSILGGLFSNLIDDISSIFEGIKKAIENFFDKVIKVIKDIANLIVDALKTFWNMLIGDIEGYSELFETDVDDNFDMISDLYDLLLECMGVDA